MSLNQFLIASAMLWMTSMSFAQEKNLEPLLNDYIEAVGGKAAWSQVESLHLSMVGKSTSKEAKVYQYILKPHCFKSIFHFKDGPRILSYNGYNGEILDKGKRTKMPEDMQREMHEEPAFYDELIFYKEYQFPLVYVKDSLIQNTKYAMLSMLKSETDVQNYYINLENNLLEIVEEYSEEKKYNGILFKSVLSDYQQQGDILFPMVLTLYANDQEVVKYSIKKFDLNPTLTIKDFNIK